MHVTAVSRLRNIMGAKCVPSNQHSHQDQEQQTLRQSAGCLGVKISYLSTYLTNLQSKHVYSFPLSPSSRHFDIRLRSNDKTDSVRTPNVKYVKLDQTHCEHWYESGKLISRLYLQRLKDPAQTVSESKNGTVPDCRANDH